MYCGLDDDKMYYLKNISNISLYGCNINGVGLKFLKNVKTLSIYVCLLKDEYLDFLLNLNNLEELYMYKCYSVSYIKKYQLGKILGNKFIYE